MSSVHRGLPYCASSAPFSKCMTFIFKKIIYNLRYEMHVANFVNDPGDYVKDLLTIKAVTFFFPVNF